jgi:hypothetical protein
MCIRTLPRACLQGPLKGPGRTRVTEPGGRIPARKSAAAGMSG